MFSPHVGLCIGTFSSWNHWPSSVARDRVPSLRSEIHHTLEFWRLWRALSLLWLLCSPLCLFTQSLLLPSLYFCQPSSCPGCSQLLSRLFFSCQSAEFALLPLQRGQAVMTCLFLMSCSCCDWYRTILLAPSIAQLDRSDLGCPSPVGWTGAPGQAIWVLGSCPVFSWDAVSYHDVFTAWPTYSPALSAIGVQMSPPDSAVSFFMIPVQRTLHHPREAFY